MKKYLCKAEITYNLYCRHMYGKREVKKHNFVTFFYDHLFSMYINIGGESNINKSGLQCVRIIYCILSDGRTDLSAYIFTHIQLTLT